MYLLFSPSEGKNPGGSDRIKTLLFGLDSRKELLDSYNSLITSQNPELLTALFGLKKTEEFKPYLQNIYHAPVMPAIQRYSGVAYDYLQFETLDKTSQDYLYRNCIIFSNLFGAISAGDRIPNYKVKQGSKISSIVPEKFYKDLQTSSLDTLFKESLILDLRAGYYEKFYTLKQPYYTMKFLKNGKSVSHWAKAYRGVVLRTLAQHQVKNEKELLAMNYKGLELVESVPHKKFGIMLIYNVIS